MEADAKDFMIVGPADDGKSLSMEMVSGDEAHQRLIGKCYELWGSGGARVLMYFLDGVQPGDVLEVPPHLLVKLGKRVQLATKTQ